MNSTPKQVRPDTPSINGSPQSGGTAGQTGDDKSFFKRKRVIIPFLLLFIVLSAGVRSWYVRHTSFINTNDAFIDADQVSISSRVPGRILKLSASEGDSVHSGDTLVQLDDSDLRAQLQKAEASLRYLSRSAEISGVNLDKANDDFTRAEKQFKNGIITQEQYSHVSSAKKMAEVQCNMAEAQIATARTDIRIIKTQLNNTVITAPFSGTIVKKWAMEGDVVQPGQAAYSLFDLKNVWVTANYEETKLGALRPGMHVQITVDAFPGKDVTGTVLSIGNATVSQFSLIPANNAAGNFTKITQRVPVKISINHNSGTGISLLPGLSASVSISTR